MTLNLPSGNNELKIAAVGAEGLANIDLFYFSAGVSQSSCIITALADESKAVITMYPNPTTNRVHLSQSIGWQVFNTSGVMIMEGKGDMVDLTDSPSGIYFLKSNEQVFKIIKE